MDDDRGRLRHPGRAVAAVVDDGAGDLRAVLARRRGVGEGLARLRAALETADLLSAGRAGRSGPARHALVGHCEGHADLRRRAHPQAAGVARPILSFRALLARDVGLRRIPGVLRRADGRVMAGQVRFRPFAEGPERAGQRARHLRQELYRPESGIRAVHGCARVSPRHVLAEREYPAGAAGQRWRPPSSST